VVRDQEEIQHKKQVHTMNLAQNRKVLTNSHYIKMNLFLVLLPIILFGFLKLVGLVQMYLCGGTPITQLF